MIEGFVLCFFRFLGFVGNFELIVSCVCIVCVCCVCGEVSDIPFCCKVDPVNGGGVVADNVGGGVFGGVFSQGEE